MATISLVGSASRRFVSRGGVGLRQGFAILSSVAWCAFLATVAVVSVYLRTSPPDGATLPVLSAFSAARLERPCSLQGSCLPSWEPCFRSCMKLKGVLCFNLLFRVFTLSSLLTVLYLYLSLVNLYALSPVPILSMATTAKVPISICISYTKIKSFNNF